MTCDCLTIQLREVPAGFPAHFKHSSGNVFFDLNANEKISRTKTVEELSEFENITGEGVLGFSLPNTDKNRAILKLYGDSSAHKFDHTVLIPVTAITGATVLREELLRVNGRDDREKQSEVQLITGFDFWKNQLEDCKLCDLDFGSFQFDVINLVNNWINHNRYDVAGPGYYFPLVNYGNWHLPANYNDETGVLITETTVSVEDFRPWFHLLGVLEKSFCKMGWSFRSPVFESEWGRRLITYILEDLAGGQELDGFKFSTSPAADYDWTVPATGIPFTEVVRFEEDFDNGDIYQFDPVDTGGPSGTPDYWFSSGFCGESIYSTCVTVESSVSAQMRVRIVQEDENTGTIISDTGKTTLLTPGVEKDICVDTPVLTLLPEHRVYVLLELVSASTIGPIIVKSNSFFRNDPQKIQLCKGQTFRPSSLIDCDFTADAILKGAMHLIGGGRIKTDFINKTVWLFNPDRVEIWNGEVPEAFYKERSQALDISDRILCDSRVVKIEKRDLEREYQLAFSGPEDEYVQRLGYTEESPLWGRTIDFGPNFKQGIKRSPNPFFEATANIECVELQTGAFRGPIVPALWDNSDNQRKISTASEPRILYAYGYTQQAVQETLGGGVEFRGYEFEGSFVNFLPYAYQADPTEVTGLAITPTENVAYGEFETDLFRFWELTLLERMNGFESEFLAMINNCEYEAWDFRDWVKFRYQGRELLLKLRKIGDFRPCEPISTPLTFVNDLVDYKSC